MMWDVLWKAGIFNSASAKMSDCIFSFSGCSQLQMRRHVFSRQRWFFCYTWHFFITSGCRDSIHAVNASAFEVVSKPEIFFHNEWSPNIGSKFENIESCEDAFNDKAWLYCFPSLLPEMKWRGSPARRKTNAWQITSSTVSAFVT